MTAVTTDIYLFSCTDNTIDLFQYKWQFLSVFQIKIFYGDTSHIRPAIGRSTVRFYPLSLWIWVARRYNCLCSKSTLLINQINAANTEDNVLQTETTSKATLQPQWSIRPKLNHIKLYCYSPLDVQSKECFVLQHQLQKTLSQPY